MHTNSCLHTHHLYEACIVMPNKRCYMHMHAYEHLPSYPTRYEAASLWRCCTGTVAAIKRRHNSKCQYTIIQIHNAYAIQMPCLLPSYPTRYEAASLWRCCTGTVATIGSRHNSKCHAMQCDAMPQGKYHLQKIQIPHTSWWIRE